MYQRKFEQQIASMLSKAGLDFEREPSIGGLQPDFLVRGPKGEAVVVEAKRWDPRDGNTARALEQVEHYRDVSGVDQAFVVLPELKKNFQSKGVVDPKTLLDSLGAYFGTSHGRKRRSKVRRRSDKTVFAAMPFAREYDDTYFIAMSYAAEKVGAACMRVDKTEFVGDIVKEIHRLIRKSICVIIDLSESKPNVLYEAGYAHAIRKPSVHITSSPTEELPFDVRNWNTLTYSRGQTSALRTPLARRLREVIR